MHDDKCYARGTVQSYLKNGTIIKSPCEVCGNTKVDAHHSDYSNPQLVNWLCKKHHSQLHAILREEGLNGNQKDILSKMQEHERIHNFKGTSMQTLRQYLEPEKRKGINIIIRNVPRELRKVLKNISINNDEPMNSLIVRVLSSYAEEAGDYHAAK
jgi:hypothetical protein